MNELHYKFKDQGLVVIGVNVMGDTEEKASDFVTRKGDRMAYQAPIQPTPIYRASRGMAFSINGDREESLAHYDTYREELRALKENKQAPQPPGRGTGR